MLGLHCFVWAFSSFGEWGPLFLTALASPVVELRLWVVQALVVMLGELSSAVPGFEGTGFEGTGFGVPGLSCSEACGIFPDQGSNLWFLHWQADSLPLSH